MIHDVVPLTSRYGKLHLARELFPDGFSRDRNGGPGKDGALPSYIHIRPDAPPKYVPVLLVLPRVRLAFDPLLSLLLLPPLPLPFA